MEPQENNYQPENNLPPIIPSTNNLPPTPPAINNLTNQTPPKPRGHIFLFILLFLLVLSGAFGVWYFSHPLPSENFSVAPVATTNQFADWQTYKNDEYSFQYPKDWSLSKNTDESNNDYIEVSKKMDKVVYRGSQDVGQATQIDNIGSIDIYSNDQKMTLGDFLKSSGFTADIGSSTTFSNNSAFIRNRVCELYGCEEFVYVPDFGVRIITNDYFSDETNTTIQKILSTFKLISTSTPTTNQ